MPPARRWSSYEPVPGGVRLYGDDGQAQLFASTPALDALVAGLPPRTGAPLAQAGGGGGAGGSSGGGDTRPPAPPPTATDAPTPWQGPPAEEPAGYSGVSGPEPVSREPPPAPAPPQQPAQTSSMPPRAPPLAQTGQSTGVDLPDPSRLPRSPMSSEELEIRLLEDEKFRRAQAASRSPVRKMPATWLPESRSVERKEVDPANFDELRRAQLAAAESEERLAQEKTKAEAEALALDQSKQAKETEFQARQEASTRLFQEEQARLEAEIEAERQALKDPKDFWKDKTTADKVAGAIGLVFAGLGGAITGDNQAAPRALQEAINEHMARRQANVEALVKRRGRGKEDFDLKNAALAAERNQALSAIDAQVKATLARGQNPVLQELLEEDVPITPEAVERHLLTSSIIGPDGKARPIQPYGNIADIPREKRILFEFGPDGQLVPRMGPVRYLVAEHARNVARLQAARENLGYAGQFAATVQGRDKYIPERTVGGGPDPLQVRMQILRDRMARGEKVDERDLKAAGILAPLAGAQAKRAEEREEKEGARTFVVPGPMGSVEYVARPGTSEKEMQEIRGAQADVKSLDGDIRRLEKLSTVANRRTGAKDLEGISASMTAKINALNKGGVLNDGERAYYLGLLQSTDWFSPGGVQAAREINASLKGRLNAFVEQTGAKPRQGR